jgi:hypothetical protein
MNGKNEIAALTRVSASDTEALVQKIVAARLQRAPSSGQMTLRINISLDPGNIALPGDDTRDPNEVPENSAGSDGNGSKSRHPAAGNRKNVAALQVHHPKPTVTGSKRPAPSVSLNSGSSLPGGISSISLAVTFGGNPSLNTASPGVPGDDTQDPNNVPED